MVPVMGGSLAALANGFLQAALDLSSPELVKRGSGRLQEGIQTDANTRGRAKSTKWDLERHTKCNTGKGEILRLRVDIGSVWVRKN